MAPRKCKNNLVARLVTDKTMPCAFCNRNVDDEVLYGKLYAIGDIQCHYFCVLLSSCLMQKGKDEHGLFGFLYEDILTEIQRCKKHKCSYCNQVGANLGCSISQCRKQFHLPCGREKNSVSLFYGNYKSFCQNHAPKQQIPESIMIKAKARKSRDNKLKKMSQQDCNIQDIKELSIYEGCVSESEEYSVCVICYEKVDGYPTINTFWPPCCARDAWFHRNCLQRMALSAGLHYLKCPLCNDKAHFYEAVISQGYYIPDRDAAWELEQNAFAEIYERPVTCSAVECVCPMGRSHDADIGAWSIRVCGLCGSSGEHSGCSSSERPLHLCGVCEPLAPPDLARLARMEPPGRPAGQAPAAGRRRGPLMPSRMSLRRTKRAGDVCLHSRSSSTQVAAVHSDSESQTCSRHTHPPTDNSSMAISPLKLQWSPNKAQMGQRSPGKGTTFDSPTKLIEEGLKNRFGANKIPVKDHLVRELRHKCSQPRPLSVKRKIVNDIVNGLLELLPPARHEPSECASETTDNSDDVIMLEQTPEIIDLTHKEEPIQETPSTDIEPNISANKSKSVEIESHSSLEISAREQRVNIDVINIDQILNNKTAKRNSFTFSPCQQSLHKSNVHLDVDTFKNEYLNEVSGSSLVDHVKKMSENRNSEQKIVVEYQAKKRNLHRRSISIKNKNIKVKIKWRTRTRRAKVKLDNAMKQNNKYRQYVLNSMYCVDRKQDPETSEACSMISKPDVEVAPLRRKYVKQDKSPDKLVQTCIDKFFKLTSAPGGS